MIFAPNDIDINITPEAVYTCIQHHEHSKAINMALHLREAVVIKTAVDSVSMNEIELVALSIDIRLLKELLYFISEEMVSVCDKIYIISIL